MDGFQSTGSLLATNNAVRILLQDPVLHRRSNKHEEHYDRLFPRRCCGSDLPNAVIRWNDGQGFQHLDVSVHDCSEAGIGVRTHSAAHVTPAIGQEVRFDFGAAKSEAARVCHSPLRRIM